MKVVILKTFPSEGRKIMDSYRHHIFEAQPHAHVDICAVANGESIPDPYEYDLVIITGGTFDLLTTPPISWVQSIITMVRTLALDTCNTPKLLGICWGHQVIQKALDGHIGALSEGPRDHKVGIEQLLLLPKGKLFFDKETLVCDFSKNIRIVQLLPRMDSRKSAFRPLTSPRPSFQSLHKFHRREVVSISRFFIPLEVNKEILLSESGRILTFQGHPEMTEDIVRDLLNADMGFYTEKATPNPNIRLSNSSAPHDGSHVWRTIMEWVME